MKEQCIRHFVFLFDGLRVLVDWQIICSMSRVPRYFPLWINHLSQNIPNELKNKTVGQVFLTLIEPPVGALIAALVSTFGIYLFASFLYVSFRVAVIWIGIDMETHRETPGTCFLASRNTFFLLPASRMFWTCMRSVTYTMYVSCRSQWAHLNLLF